MQQPNERIIGLYEENAAAFDRQRGRDLFERPWMERFAALLPPGGSILDIGCGMGEPIARFFIEQGFAVTGLDSAPSMIGLCRHRFPDHGWIVGDMRRMDLPARFDGILAWHSFFHLSPADQRPMIPRLAAHAAPGGHLMMTTGPMEGEKLGSWEGEPLYHGSLGPDEYRARLEQAGFEILDHVIQDPGCGGSTILLARYEGSAGQ